MPYFLQIANLILIIICIYVLSIYGLRTILLIIKNASLVREDGFSGVLRVKSILGIIYAFFLALLIGRGIVKFEDIGYISLEVVNKVLPPPPEVVFIVLLNGSLVGAAFLCNFSRAFFNLNALEHGIFENDSKFGIHLDKPWKRLLEFISRGSCALLFVFLEQSLANYINSPSEKKLEQLCSVGIYALILYIALFIWWIINKYFQYTVSRVYLVFYILGILVSGFIILLAINDSAIKPFLIYFALSLTFLASSLMIAFIIHHSLKLVRNILRDIKDVFLVIRNI